MKITICLMLLAGIFYGSNAQENGLMVDDNEFMVGKTVVAKVKDVKLGAFQGREL